MLRRSFIKGLGLAGLGRAFGQSAQRERQASFSLGAENDREYWLQNLLKIVDPVITNLADGQLKARMPVEQIGEDRSTYSHLEAFGRSMAGLAPWLEARQLSQEEDQLRRARAKLAVQALAEAVDPSSPDYLNFTAGGQPLVDAAFLAHAVVRAPNILGRDLEATTRHHLAQAFHLTRRILPVYSNWLLFSAMVEAALYILEGEYDPFRVDLAVRKFSEWYVGDGCYSDGPEYHWDYYNSYVIQPFLLDILGLFKTQNDRYTELYDRQVVVSQRYGEILERLIAPDGTFPPVGRSITYRSGAFQLLAQLALRDDLPDSLVPQQVRSGLTAVIKKTLVAPGTFDAGGWLRIGLSGAQPGLAERYISTGSLYLCSTIFLPLGLSPETPFWSMPHADWTSRQIWSGQNANADHALEAERLGSKR